MTTFEPYAVIDPDTGHEHMVLAHTIEVWVRGKGTAFRCDTDSEAAALVARLAPTGRRIDVVTHPTFTLDLSELDVAARKAA